MMLQKSLWAIALIAVIATDASADLLWTGAVNDSWSNSGNWVDATTLGQVAGNPTSLTQRARIQKTSDTGNWPVIKNGETFNQTSRVLGPFGPPAAGSNLTTFAHLTIQNGGTLTVGDDFLFGDNTGTATEPYVSTLDVAGALNVAERIRFGQSDFTTVDVNVTGAFTQTVSNQDFRIENGVSSTVTFDILASGITTVASPFSIGDGGVLSLSGNGKLVLLSTAGPTLATALANMTTWASQGRVVGLTNTYSGPEPLTRLGNGVSYFGDANSYTFVAARIVPEPHTLILVVFAAMAGMTWRRNAIKQRFV